MLHDEVKKTKMNGSLNVLGCETIPALVVLIGTWGHDQGVNRWTSAHVWQKAKRAATARQLLLHDPNFWSGYAAI